LRWRRWILPVNQVAVIEGNAGKPIYQMSKWWARRRSSVFRAMLIAAATKAPADSAHVAKLVWDNYYANHQKKGAFKHLKVADIFMGGGTTLVEGSRLGMQMFGNDLNPVAWFVVKQEFAKVDLEEVKRSRTSRPRSSRRSCRFTTATDQTAKKENGLTSRQVESKVQISIR
jgi:adenine-specific DNA methylase